MLLPIDYLILSLPFVLLPLWAQWKINSALAAASAIAASSGLTGAETAARILDYSGVEGLAIEPVAGPLTEHYDPDRRMLRLSPGVVSGRSLADLSVAAHEVGHALQEADRARRLFYRNLVVPTAGLFSTAFWILLLAGFFLELFRLISLAMVVLALGLIIQLINVPIELDASRRAREALRAAKLIARHEEEDVGRVLKFVSWTHVAGTLTNLMGPFRHLPARSPFSRRAG